MQIDIYHHFVNAPPSHLVGLVEQLLNKVTHIMATQAELAASLTALTTEVAKIGTETTTLLQKVDALQAALDAAGQTTPEVDAAMAALAAQAKTVDDLVPDAPTP